MADRPPERVGPWRIERLLGRGGMADVYVAVGEDGQRVSLKWLHAGASVGRFEDEARWIERLDHPNIVRSRGRGSADGRPYLLLEYIDGPDLRVFADTLRRRPPGERQERVRAIARDLCRALGHVHAQGLVHRDVKPANVLLAPDGRAVLTDFGVAAEGAPVTGVGMLIGTAAYAAPEQLRGEPLDPRADQYGLGCTLYHALTGRKPFEEEATPALLQAHLERAPRPPSELDPTIPADLEAFVLRLMAKSPEDRFLDMAQAEAAIGASAPVGLPLAGRQEMVDAVAAVLDRVAAGKGVVLRLVGPRGSGRDWLARLARDSAQRRHLACVWTDEPLALGAAVRRVSAGEALLVVTTRPGHGAEELVLRPLTVADLRRSTYALAPHTADLARVAERLHRESGGNPGLFLHIVSRHTREGRVELPAGPLRLDVNGWIGNLDLDALSVAGALAVLRAPVTPAVLEDIAQVPALESLAELQARGVAIHVANRWSLAAEAFRAPLLALVPDAEATEERARLTLGVDEDTVPTDAVLAQAAALRDAGRHDDAEALLRAAPEDAAARPGRLLLLGALRAHLGDATGARAAYEAALAEAHGPSLRVRATLGAGTAALAAGELRAALDHLTHAAVDAELLHDTPRAVTALLHIAEARALGGELAEALRTARRALALAEALRERALECTALRHLGQVLLDAGLAEEAGRRLADAAALARAADLDLERRASRLLRARAALEERPNNRTAAAAALDRLLPLLSDPGADPGFRLLVRAMWAQVAAGLGDAPMYRRAVSHADLADAGGRVALRLRAEVALARAAWLAGDRDAAQARATAAHAVADAHGFRLLAWDAARIAARAAGHPMPPLGALADGLDAAGQKALEKKA